MPCHSQTLFATPCRPDSCASNTPWVPVKTLLVDENNEPRFLAYLAGCVLGNLAALALNSLWLQWPITGELFVTATVLALYGVFSGDTIIGACVVSVVAAVPLVLVLWMIPDFHALKQLWLAAIMGLIAGKIWVGLIR